MHKAIFSKYTFFQLVSIKKSEGFYKMSTSANLKYINELRLKSEILYKLFSNLKSAYEFLPDLLKNYQNNLIGSKIN
jgi:hypothetical protein